MPTTKKNNDQFVDAVKPALESLLSDLERTTEILRRAGKKSADDKWDSNTSSTYQSYRKSGSYADGADPYSSQHDNYSASNKSGPDYGTGRFSANSDLQGGGRNSQRVDSLMSQSEKSDYQTIPKGNCALCGDAIVGEVIIALGQMWHPQHFNCCHCGDEIGHKNFFERSGKAYCENDYHDLFSPRCSYCNGPIKERCVTAMGKHFHPEHFVCAECGKPFGEDGFHEKDGHALCKEDFFRLYAPKCKGCQKAITSKFITALDTHWHPECFVCDADEHFSKQCPMAVTYFEEEEYY